MESVSSGGILNGSLWGLRIHVLLVDLSVRHMAQPGTEQHEGRLLSVKLPTARVRWRISRVQPLNDIVGLITSLLEN